jgi:ribosomal protein L30/L7E
MRSPISELENNFLTVKMEMLGLSKRGHLSIPRSVTSKKTMKVNDFFPEDGGR